jgi:hypothetical protein
MSRGKRDTGRRVVLRDFSKSLPMALMRTREAVMKRFRPSLRHHDITEQQCRVLRALDHAGPLERGGASLPLAGRHERPRLDARRVRRDTRKD